MAYAGMLVLRDQCGDVDAGVTAADALVLPSGGNEAIVSTVAVSMLSEVMAFSSSTFLIEWLVESMEKCMLLPVRSATSEIVCRQ